MDWQARFESKFIEEPNTGCYLWTAGLFRDGYGQFYQDDEHPAVRAHRLSYEMNFGSIPDDLCVLHKCDTPVCVNPDHLFLGTREENQADMKVKGRAPRGIRSGAAKLTEAQVLAIRSETRIHKEIAVKYGVSRRNIGAIKANKTWSHLEG